MNKYIVTRFLFLATTYNHKLLRKIMREDGYLHACKSALTYNKYFKKKIKLLYE